MGLARGTRMYQKDCQVDAPSIRAASNKASGMPSTYALVMRVVNGIWRAAIGRITDQ